MLLLAIACLLLVYMYINIICILLDLYFLPLLFLTSSVLLTPYLHFILFIFCYLFVEIRKEFSTFDTDGNGTISYRCLEEALTTVGRYLEQDGEEGWDSGLDKIDRKFLSEREFKVEKTIEFSEFLTMVAKQAKNTVSMMSFFRAFRTVDKNRDGALR